MVKIQADFFVKELENDEIMLFISQNNLKLFSRYWCFYVFKSTYFG